MSLSLGSDYKEQQVQVLHDAFQTQGGGILIDGSFLRDDVLVEVLEDYQENTQREILSSLSTLIAYDIYYTINAKHLVWDKQFSQTTLPFEKHCLKELAFINASLDIKPKIIITMPEQGFIPPHVRSFKELLEGLEYGVFYHYEDEAISLNSTHYIITSYEANNIPYNLIQTNTLHTQWSSFPLEKASGAYNLLGQALRYFQSLENISILDNYITYDEQLSHRIKNYLTQYLHTSEKLYQLGHLEEEDIEDITEILQQL